jgi:hypothetical protein
MEEKKLNKEEIDELFDKDKSFKKKLIIFISTIILVILIGLGIYYLLFKNLNLKTDISTDKSFETIEVNGKNEQLITQKYISSLGYQMRYDVDSYEVFKYNDSDIYKNILDNNIVISVSKSKLPSICNLEKNDKFNYNSCELINGYDNLEYYIYEEDSVYKIVVSMPTESKNVNNNEIIVNKMLNSFKIS